jgi:hypothetical protein
LVWGNPRGTEGVTSDDGFGDNDADGVGDEAIRGENGDSETEAASGRDGVADFGEAVFGAGGCDEEERGCVEPFDVSIVGVAGFEGATGQGRCDFDEKAIDANAGLMLDGEGEFVFGARDGALTAVAVGGAQ